jgi:DNA-directed RNA polymerase subunit RPC12/RpoP
VLGVDSLDLRTKSQYSQTSLLSRIVQLDYLLVIYQYYDIIVMVIEEGYYTNQHVLLGMPRVQLMGYECLRCGHKWIPRKNSESEPKVCPHCKSPYWDTPRKKGK